MTLTLHYTRLQLQLQQQLKLQLHYTTLRYTTTTTTATATTLHYSTHTTIAHYTTKNKITLHSLHNITTTTATTLHSLHYTTATAPLHDNYSYSCPTPHYIQLQPFQKTQLQPPFGPSVDLFCHPCITTAHLSYLQRPIFETSATALCGIYIYIYS